MNNNISADLQQALERTRRQGGLSQSQYQDIETAITSSPTLKSYIQTAVENGDLKHLALAPSRLNVSGFYDGQAKVVHLTPEAWGLSDEKRAWWCRFIRDSSGLGWAGLGWLLNPIFQRRSGLTTLLRHHI